MDKQVKIVINKSEIAAGTRGASLGPEAILTVSRQKKDAFINDIPKISIENENHALDQSNTMEYGHYMEAYSRVFNRLQGVIEQELRSGFKPFVLAGDHGSAAATILGIRKAYPQKRLGVIWIDAHADLHSPLTTPSGNIHGMPLSLVLGNNNEACSVNQPDEKTLALWESLRSPFVSGLKVLPTDLVYIALRDYEEPENHLIQEMGLKVITVDDVRMKGAGAIKDEVLDYLSSCDLLYVSFDVDSMDPIEASYGTGTPVKNGLSVDEASDLLVGFASSGKVVCTEIVEVNPCLDNRTNRMAEIAFDLMRSFISSWKTVQ
jgi:arginase